ncbi:MAG: cysteine peptidase family C39 domain-containing protein [Erysipelotrichaceae bacterium]|nr:cysteine peptidase family C39 domain-containing protein [Erysipelotrichaceae bacterium]
MKVKYQQIYSNECGLCAIKNLLRLYGKKDEKCALSYHTNGTSIYSMKETLQKYFYKVEAVYFDINQIKKVKKFLPFIALIKHTNSTHYILVYRRGKKHLYIIDSLKRKSYRITYEKFNEISLKKYIVVEDFKEAKMNIKKNKAVFIMPLISLIESVLLLSTTVLIQQIIDNGLKDGLLYIIVQIFIFLILLFKVKTFLKMFKNLDEDLVSKSLDNIYHLKKEYIDRHIIDEVYYRVYDAYTYKEMILSFIFNVISNIMLAITTISLMIVYSLSLTLIVLPICLIVIVISFFVFKKTQMIVEQRRISEYSFFNHYVNSFKNIEEIYVKNDEAYHQISKKHLLEFQKNDYKYEKIKMSKNIILSYFQSLVVSLMVILYFSSFYEMLSLGSLIALINLSTLVLNPILDLCSEIINFSNYRLIKNRIKDINENVMN